MKIGIDISPMGEINYTGVGVYVENLIQALAKIDKENEYYLCYRFSRLKYKWMKNPVEQDNFHLKIIQEPLNFLFQNKLDIFHGPGDRLPDFSHPKKIVTIHDLAAIKGGDFMTDEFRDMVKKRYAELLVGKKKADAIVTVSENSKRDICEYYNIKESMVSVVYHGVDEQYRPMPAEERVPKLKLLGVEGRYILNVSAQQERKNIVGILEAFRRYIDNSLDGDVTLVLCGKPTYGYDRIVDTMRRLNLEDRVKTIGHVSQDELTALYSGAMMLCFPSLYEGFGMPIVEAFACGCPVITSNITSMPEVAGDAAVLVNPLDIDELEGAMHRLSKGEERDAFVALGLERARQFTWEKAARQILDVYRSLS